MKQKNKILLGKIVTLIAVIGLVFGPMPIAHAAQVTSFSDTLSRLKDSTAANHEIKFVTPTGVQDTNDTITFLMTGFTSASVDAITATDVDFAVGDSNNCSTATFTDQAVSGTTGSGATWGFDTDGSNLMTLDPGTATITADRCVRLRVGTNAVSTNGSGPGVNQITNGTAATAHSVTIGGVFGDSGTAAIDIISDDQVAITATVDPTITFTISDNTIGFGSLSASAARWADGSGSGSATDTSAHSLTVATNAASGYVLSYIGNTLTSGSNTICSGSSTPTSGTACAAITNDANGTQGTEEFGLGVDVDNSSTITTGYDHNAVAGNRDWAWVHNQTTTLVSRTSPTNTETINAYYLANIGGATEAGAYSTTVTYIATGYF